MTINGTTPIYEDIHVGGAGLNYRWPHCEGPCDNLSKPDCDELPGAESCYEEGAAPIFSYDHSIGSAVIGGIVYRTIPSEPTGFSPFYDGAYFYGDYGRDFIRYLEFDAADNTMVTGDFEFADAVDIVYLIEGPDGGLYYIEFNASGPGHVRRIVAAAAPVITQVEADVSFAEEPPLTVNFTGAAEDFQGHTVFYRWKFTPPDGPVVYDPATPSETGNNVAWEFQTAGVHLAQLEVQDDDDPVNVAISDPLRIEIGRPPTPEITSVTNCETFRAGDTIVLTATTFDPDDPIGEQDVLFEFDVLIQHALGGTAHTHTYLDYSETTNLGSSTFSFAIPTYADGGLGQDFHGHEGFEVRVTTTDVDGLSGTTSLILRAEKVVLTLDSDPCGITVSISNSVNQDAPVAYDVLVGFDIEIVTAAQACALNSIHEFAEWEDLPGLPDNSRVITAPESDSSYTAVYTTANTDCELPSTDDLVMHLSGSQGVTTDGSAVQGWDDLVGTHHLTAIASDNSRPTLILAGLNNRDFVQFDGVNDMLQRISGGNLLPAGDTDRSIFMVTRYRSAGWGGFTYGPSTGGLLDNTTFGLAVDDDPTGGRLAIQGWGTADDPSSTTGENADWIIQSVVRTHGAPEDRTRHFKDSVEIDTTAHVWGTSIEEIRLGSKFDESTFVAMDVAEILVYDVGMADLDRVVVEDFLRDKYFFAFGPSAQNDTAHTRPGRATAVSVLDNDCDPDGFLDPDSIVITTPPAFASEPLSIANGIITYHHDVAATEGVDYFGYTVNDDAGNASGEAIVEVIVRCPMDNCNEVIYVDYVEQPSNRGDGKSWNTAFRRLQDALDVACPGDEIRVAAGTYRPDESFDVPSGSSARSASFQLVSGVELYGGFDGTETTRDERDYRSNVTILSGDLDENDIPPFVQNTNNAYHAITASGVTSTSIVDGFTIRSGNADDTTPGSLDGFGGGILIDGDAPMSDSGSPTVRNCVLKFRFSSQKVTDLTP